MSIGSLDQRLQQSAAISSLPFPPLPPVPPLSAPAPSLSVLEVQLHMLTGLIDDWGQEVWRSPDDAAISKPVFISRMLAIKGAVSQSLSTLQSILTQPPPLSSSSSAPAASSSSSPATKAVRNYCQCRINKAGLQCSTKHCKCLKNGSACSSLCHCSSSCSNPHNKNVPAPRLVGIETNPGPPKNTDDLLKCFLVPASKAFPIIEIYLDIDDDNLVSWPRIPDVYGLAGPWETKRFFTATDFIILTNGPFHPPHLCSNQWIAEFTKEQGKGYAPYGAAVIANVNGLYENITAANILQMLALQPDWIEEYEETLDAYEQEMLEQAAQEYAEIAEQTSSDEEQKDEIPELPNAIDVARQIKNNIKQEKHEQQQDLDEFD